MRHNCTADEKPHEIAYERIVEKHLEMDPTETMTAIKVHLRRNPHLFSHLSAVAQCIGVYTVNDYIDILEFLIGWWRLKKLEGLTSEGKRA
ncbi:stearoyl-acyl-carrier desaturase [Medicago truncatula]|uniref:Stearoyl-acyl-carrier desaturase n=1 Tax=Medicago truncatula TaxID=3880 RepID=G7J5N2_MEDTR|nr:stearoyl-acyl-carrier desaturase [Medicago truncatula]